MSSRLNETMECVNELACHSSLHRAQTLTAIYLRATLLYKSTRRIIFAFSTEQSE
jgi:hypothetical protein